MKTILIGLMGIFLLTGCAQERSDVIKIALACPLTGDVAAVGQGMKRAVEMAIDEANASGSLKGFSIKLEAFDDKADPKEAVNIANRIISDRRIWGVVGHLNSGCSIPASQVYARRSLVMLSPASTNPKLTRQGLKNVFRICTTDDVQGGFAAGYVLKTLGKNNVAVIHDKTAYGQGLAENFKQSFEKRGGKIISFNGIDLGDKDFKALLTAINYKNPSLLYFGGMYTEAALISKQARELGMLQPLFSDDGSFTQEYIKIGGKATEGNYATMVGLPPEKLPQSKKFIKSYSRKYSAVDMQPYDPYAYEATNIIIEAINRTKRDRSKIIDYIANIKYNGILGKTSFDEKGDTLNKTVSVYKVTGGKFIYAGK
jgi:branched-chain amino acid transport system substrate-binding protein